MWRGGRRWARLAKRWNWEGKVDHIGGMGLSIEGGFKPSAHYEWLCKYYKCITRKNTTFAILNSYANYCFYKPSENAYTWNAFNSINLMENVKYVVSEFMLANSITIMISDLGENLFENNQQLIITKDVLAAFSHTKTFLWVWNFAMSQVFRLFSKPNCMRNRKNLLHLEI